MTTLEIFAWGVLGSLAIEVVNLNQIFQADKVVFPERYKKCSFNFVRLLLACLGGGLAIAYEIDKPLLAINIGVSAPLILQFVSQGIKTPALPDVNEEG